jgi:hypothetical protein
MRMHPTRKCTSLANVDKFDALEHSNFRYHHRLALIQAYGNWVQQYLDEGWDGYLLTFMFNQMPGSRYAMVQQMQQEILGWYGRLATRTVRKPRSPVWAPLLPKGIFVPDLPVPKRSKQPIIDVLTNEGLHMHGIVVANRSGRIHDTLDVHFEENLETYLTKKLRHIDVERITHQIEYTTEYGIKGLKRPAFSEDDILILPRELSELPDSNHLPPGNKRIKDIQASLNVSDEVAQEIASRSSGGGRNSGPGAIKPSSCNVHARIIVLRSAVADPNHRSNHGLL